MKSNIQAWPDVALDGARLLGQYRQTAKPQRRDAALLSQGHNWSDVGRCLRRIQRRVRASAIRHYLNSVPSRRSRAGGAQCSPLRLSKGKSSGLYCGASLSQRSISDLWQNQRSLQRVASVAAMQEKAIEPFRAGSRSANARRTGTITALDLTRSDAGYLADIGPKLHAFFRSRNLLVRPLGNTTYAMPPYCATATDLEEIYSAINDAPDGLV